MGPGEEITRRVFAGMGAAATAVAAGSAGAAAPSPTDLSARDAARAIRDGSISAETYAGQCIRRHQAHAALKVSITFDEGRVLAQARAIDQARKAGRRLGALAGLPFVIKDQIEAASYPTTAGTPALAGYVSKADSPVVAAMLRQGAVLFAKANMHELAGGGTSNNPAFGTVGNPYAPSRTPGGSSGGTAAAIAARIVPLGLGEDTGGSVRIPAGFCGIAGLRPTSWPGKLYSDAGMVPPPAPDDIQTIGPMARTVSDVAFLHAAVTGQSIPAVGIRGLRIGVPEAAFWDGPTVDPAVARVTQDALARLRDAGAVLVEVKFDAFVEVGNSISAVVASGSHERFARWLAQNVPGVSLQDVVRQISSPDVKASYDAPAAPASPLSAAEKRRAREAAGRRYAELFRAAGIACVAFPNPTILAPPQQRGPDPVVLNVEVRGKPVLYRSVALRNTMFGPRLGAPGLNLPAGMAAGLPVGLELEARPGEDSRLLAIGMALEQVVGPLPPPPGA